VSSRAAAISYAPAAAFEADMWQEVDAAIAAGAVRVCDVGGGARPVLVLPGIERRGLDYLVLDESTEELERAPGGYQRAAASILDARAVGTLIGERGSFDLVISRWTAEHVRDGRVFHEHVFALLRPGGRAIHLFPTLYAPPFIINRLLPAGLSMDLLFRTCPERIRKFQPYYSWCRGPSRRQLARLESVGFEIERYRGYFGHRFYERVPPLAAAQGAFNRVMLEHPLAAMTAFALVVLRRPS